MSFEKISKDDFFAKSVEFRQWLSTKDIFFTDLDTKQAKKHFAKFVKKWNAGKLKAGIYTQDVNQTSSARQNTNFKWGFADTNKTKQSEKQNKKTKQETKQNAKKHKKRLLDQIDVIAPQRSDRQIARDIKRRRHAPIDVQPEILTGIDLMGHKNPNALQRRVEQLRAKKLHQHEKKCARADQLLQAHQQREEEVMKQFRAMIPK